jgi:hypothetical protein
MEKIVSSVIDIYPDDNLASLLNLFARLNHYGGFVGRAEYGEEENK